MDEQKSEMQTKPLWQKIEDWAENNPKKTITIIATVVSAIFPKAQAIISQVVDIIGSTLTQ